jgi:very-short-patch-repair endonuclease
MFAAAAILASLGRMARTAELRALGVSERELTRAVRTGEVVRPRQGVYALPDASRHFVHAAAHGGTVSCGAAAELHDLWMLRVPERSHVWMGASGTPRGKRDGCRFHWDDGQVVVGEPPPVRNVLLQLAVCADEETFFAALESALRHHRITSNDKRWLRRRVPPQLKWLVGFARTDADSGLESLVRLRLHRVRIRVRTQVIISGVGEVDFVIGRRLILEADGRENHDGPDKRHKDLLRDAKATALGYRTLRFDYDLIVHDWPVVEAAILAALSDA